MTFFPQLCGAPSSDDSDEDQDDDVLALVTVVNLTLHKVIVKVF